MHSSLLSDWGWLQEHLSPLVFSDQARPGRVWSVGSVENAVAITAALTRGQERVQIDLRTYATGWTHDPLSVSFASTEIEAVPDVDRAACFRRKQRRWVPQPVIADQVILAEPGGSVDLVAWGDDGAHDGSNLEAAVRSHLRCGGHFFFPEPPSYVPHGLRPVSEGQGRLYRKEAPASGESRSMTDDSGQTLARRQMQQELVSQHINLARSLARRFLHRGEPADDLQQVAFLALIKAAQRFDPEQHTAFSTFATVSILGELKRHFRDKTWMLRVPRSAQELYLTIKSAREELGHELGRSPTIPEISARLGVAEESVLEAMEAGETYWPRSLDVRGEGGERVIDPAEEDLGLDLAVEREQLRSVLPHLDLREHLILKRIFFDGETQKKVADEIGVSQMQVSRLLSRALDKSRRQVVDLAD